MLCPWTQRIQSSCLLDAGKSWPFLSGPYKVSTTYSSLHFSVLSIMRRRWNASSSLVRPLMPRSRSVAAITSWILLNPSERIWNFHMSALCLRASVSAFDHPV